MICPLCRRDIPTTEAIKVKSSLRQRRIVREPAFCFHLGAELLAEERCPASWLTLSKAAALAQEYRK